MIKIIYHLADIHIPEKSERHEEYREVFERVKEIIKGEKREKMVVICGDYFDVKHISGTTLQLGIEILRMLSENSEVVIFGGNHDINARNENNIPYIEAITGENIIYKNKVHYIKENKTHKINGINFVLTTITAEKVTKIENREIKHLIISECSGYERTAFNIALRLALNSLNVSNRNNFIFIDEQFSTADHKNLGRVINLLETIKKEYEICIIISHLNEIKEINERKIEIKCDEKTKDSNIFID